MCILLIKWSNQIVLHMFFCVLSEEHVSVLLDIRGDVSRDIRGAVLDLLEQSAPPLPAGYRPIFTDILVPPSTMAFCLPTAKCAWRWLTWILHSDFHIKLRVDQLCHSLFIRGATILFLFLHTHSVTHIIYTERCPVQLSKSSSRLMVQGFAQGANDAFFFTSSLIYQGFVLLTCWSGSNFDWISFDWWSSESMTRCGWTNSMAALMP